MMLQSQYRATLAKNALSYLKLYIEEGLRVQSSEQSFKQLEIRNLSVISISCYNEL